MISNQIALKPFIASAAAQANLSVPAFYDKAVEELKSPGTEEFISSPEFQQPLILSQALRVKSSDQAEMIGEFSNRGVDAKTATAFAQQMTIGALASQPGIAAGLDGCFRLLMMDEKPLANTTVNADHQISIKPALEAATQAMGTDVDGFIAQAAEEYKSNPQAANDPNLAAGKEAASVFQPVPSEVQEFQAKFAAQGLPAEASDALISGLVLNAVAYEPTFRPGLNTVFGQLMQQQQGGSPSATTFEPV